MGAGRPSSLGASPLGGGLQGTAGSKEGALAVVAALDDPAYADVTPLLFNVLSYWTIGRCFRNSRGIEVGPETDASSDAKQLARDDVGVEPIYGSS